MEGEGEEMIAEQMKAIAAPRNGKRRGEQYPDINMAIIHAQPDITTPGRDKGFRGDIEKEKRHS
jgi:hypothetical protein